MLILIAVWAIGLRVGVGLMLALMKYVSSLSVDETELG